MNNSVELSPIDTASVSPPYGDSKRGGPQNPMGFTLGGLSPKAKQLRPRNAGRFFAGPQC